MGGEPPREGGGPIDPGKIVGNPLRRRILSELPTRENPVHIDDLVAAILTSPDGNPGALPVEATDAESVTVQLYHQHLPVLAAAGWLEFDAGEGVVRYDAEIEHVLAELAALAEDVDRLRESFRDAARRSEGGATRSWGTGSTDSSTGGRR